MKYWDIMDGEEKGTFISFDSEPKAQNWLSDHTKNFPEYAKENGMHIVEKERQTLSEKCFAQQKEIEQLKRLLFDKTKSFKRITKKLLRENEESNKDFSEQVDEIDRLCGECTRLSKENDKLNTEISVLREQLPDGDVMEALTTAKEQLEIIKDNIKEFPPEGMTIGKDMWIQSTNFALDAIQRAFMIPHDLLKTETSPTVASAKAAIQDSKVIGGGQSENS